MSKRPSGIVCPLATPLNRNEELDRRGLQRLVDRILPHVDGVFLLGSSSEFPLLRDTVSQEVVDVAIEHINRSVPVYVGVGATSTSRALQNLPRAVDAGADFAVALTGFYHAVPDQRAIKKHFLCIAEASELPVILYNIPQNTANPLRPSTVTSLAEHPNIVGIKDSSGDMIAFSAFLRSRSRTFSVMQGREQLAAASLWLGSDGIISALGNVAPDLLKRLLVAVQQSDREVALELQRQVDAVAEIFTHGHWLSALKASLEALGIGSGTPIGPQPTCTNDQKEAIRRILREVGVMPEQGHE